jgi:hypothetical protein
MLLLNYLTKPNCVYFEFEALMAAIVKSTDFLFVMPNTFDTLQRFGETKTPGLKSK